AILDQSAPFARNPLRIERMRAKAALAQRIVDDVDAHPEDLLPELVFEEAGTARDRRSVDGGGEMSNERAGYPWLEDDRHFAGRDLAWVKPARRPFARGAADRFRRLEVGDVDRRRKVVVALHSGPFAGDRLH